MDIFSALILPLISVIATLGITALAGTALLKCDWFVYGGRK